MNNKTIYTEANHRAPTEPKDCNTHKKIIPVAQICEVVHNNP